MIGVVIMTNETRAHIRSILWQYKKIEKTFKEFSDIIATDRNPYMEYPLGEENPSWTMNQILFYKSFLRVVNGVLEDSTLDVRDIFYVKYYNGHSKKCIAIVAAETFLSESTIKRRDAEFINEIAKRLGWLSV